MPLESQFSQFTTQGLWEVSKSTGVVKGQLISKCPFGIFNSPKKRTKKFSFTTMVTQVKLFSFVFGRIDTKKTFRN